MATTLLKLTSGGNSLKIKSSDIQASSQVLKKLKAVAKAKSVSIAKAIRSIDVMKTGKVGTVMFRNCIRNLGLGLTYK